MINNDKPVNFDKLLEHLRRSVQDIVVLCKHSS